MTRTTTMSAGVALLLVAAGALKALGYHVLRCPMCNTVGVCNGVDCETDAGPCPDCAG